MKALLSHLACRGFGREKVMYNRALLLESRRWGIAYMVLLLACTRCTRAVCVGAYRVPLHEI